MSNRSSLLAVPGKVDTGTVVATVLDLDLVAGVVEDGMGLGDPRGRMFARGRRVDSGGARQATLVEEVRSEQSN